MKTLHPLKSRLAAFLAAAGLLAIPSVTGHAAPPPTANKTAASETPFLFGCDWPVDGSPAVKSLFYETGCNFVRLTGGGYDWYLDRHRKALQELSGHDVKVLIQLGSHYPSGSYFDLKDSYLVDQKGETGKVDRNVWAVTYSGSAWPQYSYASPAFRAKLAQDFTAYLNGLHNPPNVAGLLLHNEPGYHWISDRVFDYNPQAVTRFRDWLKQQHGTVENLNQRWGTHFASFDAVEPPHDLPPVSNVAAWLDWRRFHADLIQDFLRGEIEFAHRTLPGVPTTTNLPGTLDNWYPIRLSDNYRYTADDDIAGIDVYPSESTTFAYPGYVLDMTRGAAQGKKLYVEECEVFDGARFAGLSEETRAGMLRSLVWTLIGHGADGILLWSLSGQGGFHLTAGEFNARLAATREIAHLAPMLHLGAFHKPAARVAVCVDQDSFLFYGGREPKLEGGYHADEAARGLYVGVAGGRYQADVVSASQIRQGLSKRYSALMLSLPVLMDADLAGELRAFVAGGGLLLTEAPFAGRDRWGRELPQSPGFGLGDVLGIRDVRPQAAEGGTITTLNGVFASRHRTQFTLAGAQIAGTFADKQPAVSVHPFGKGTAIYLAAEIGGANAAPSGPGLQTFLAAALARYAHLQPVARLTYTGSVYLDSSFRQDGRGNELIVLADPADRAKPLPPATGVSLSLAATDLPPGTQAFDFPAARTEGGRVTAGPQPLLAQRDGTGRPSLTLPDVASALPLLLARDASPLLTVSAPESAASGVEVAVSVICYNPSPRPLRGTVSLDAPASWKVLDAPASVVLPARGNWTVLLRVRAGGEARSVVKARLDYGSSAHAQSHVVSVPLDVYATPPPP